MLDAAVADCSARGGRHRRGAKYENEPLSPKYGRLRLHLQTHLPAGVLDGMVYVEWEEGLPDLLAQFLSLNPSLCTVIPQPHTSYLCS